MATEAAQAPRRILSGATARPAFRVADWTTVWMVSVVGLAALSLTGALALLLTGFGSSVLAIIAVVAAIATGVLGHLAPHPASSEVLSPSRGEAF